MTLYKNEFRTETTRLRNWDYSFPWWYYVTINTKGHKEYFGEIINDVMLLSDIGEIVQQELLRTTEIRSNVELDSYIIMPSHLHAIVTLNENNNLATRDKNEKRKEKHQNEIFFSNISPKSNSLSTIIRSFKSSVTKLINEKGINNFEWQSRFYDRIIRNEKELAHIREYIARNPLKWAIDKNEDPIGLL